MARGDGPGLFTVFALSAFLLVGRKSGITVASHHQDDFCLRSISGNYTENLEHWMNPQVDPCDNFYQFVCGGLPELSANSCEMSLFFATEIEIYNLLKENIEKASQDDEISVIRNAKNLYSSCTRANSTKDEEAFSAQKGTIRFLSNHLKKVGHWPLLESGSWDERAFDWKQTILNVTREGSWYTNLFPFKVSLTLDDVPAFLHPYPELVKTNHRLKYFSIAALEKHHRRRIRYANATTARKDLTKVVHFKLALAQKYHECLSSDPGPAVVSWGQLKTDFPFYPWDDFLKQAYPSSSIQVRPDQQINITNYNFIREYYKLIEATDKRVVANYMAWREIEAVAESLRAFNDVGYSKCLKMVNHYLPHSLGTLYARATLDQSGWKERTEQAQTIAKGVQSEFVKLLENATWLRDETTRNNAQKGIKSLTFEFDYSDELYHGTILDKYYENLTINENSSFIDSIVRVNRIFYNRDSSEIDFDRAYWSTFVEAKYNQPGNFIKITLGLLGHRFTGSSGSAAQTSNYGVFAHAIGRELGRSLVLRARLSSNKQDKYIFVSQDDFQEYNQKVECLQNQYRDENKRVNMPEAVMNDVGFQTAYFAHKNSRAGADDHQTLHGKSYNRDQMFWINSASVYCAKKDFFLKYFQYSIVGALSNIQPFSEDFHCPANSTMNPPSRCNIV